MGDTARLPFDTPLDISIWFRDELDEECLWHTGFGNSSQDEDRPEFEISER